MDQVIRPKEEDCKTFETQMYTKKLKVMLFQLDKSGNGLDLIFTRDTDYDYEKLKDELPKDDGAVIVYDFSYKSKDGKTPNHLVCINYVPESTKVFRRFKYPTACKGVANRFGIQYELQASDWSQMDTKALLDKFDK